MHRRPFAAVALLGIAIGLSAGVPAHATPLGLTRGLSVSMASGTTASLTLSATNLAGGTGDITTFNGFGLALQLIPQGGAVGTVVFSGFAAAAANGILPDPGEPQFELDGIATLSPVNGTSLATPVALLMSELAAQQEATVPQGVLKNLGIIEVAASGNAAGIWTLYAVNDAFGRSYWTDAVGNETAFDQLPATNGTAIAIGTVSIVPEPSAVALALGGAVSIVAAARRRMHAER